MRDKVRHGYEAGDYEGEFRNERDIRKPELELFQKLFDRLPEDGKILDLGCGTGEPFDRYMVDEGYDVKGIDLVEKHIHSAREHVPEAEFDQCDFFDVDPELEKFDAVVSFYAIFHIPREEHGKLLNHIADLTEDGGAILITMGGGEMEEYQDDDWVGSEMIWSSYSQDKSLELVEKAGFDVVETYEEESDEEHHLWILAEKN